MDIFKYFIEKPEDTPEIKKKKKGYLTVFLDQFPISEFEKEDKVFYHMLSCAQKINAPITLRFVEVYSASEVMPFISENRVLVTGAEDCFLDDVNMLKKATVITGDILEKEFIRLSNEEANIEDFIIDLKEWTETTLRDRFKILQNQAFSMLSKPVHGKQGAKAATTWMIQELSRARDIYSDDVIQEFQKVNRAQKLRPVFRSALAPISNVIPAVYSTELLTVAAGPGVGKTSLVFGDIIYNSIVHDKQDIMAFCLEQTEEYIRAGMVARHIRELTGLIYSADAISKKKYTKPEDLERIEIARYDLFESGRYGKLYIRDKTKSFFLDDMEDTFEKVNNMFGPFDGLVIDHMAIIRQDPKLPGKKMNTSEIPKEAYIRLVKYLGISQMAGIAINQLNRDGALQARQGKKVTPDGYAGGIEAERSSDYILIVEMTEQMEGERTRKIYSNKNRVGPPILPFMAKVWLTCMYYQVMEEINLAS